MNYKTFSTITFFGTLCGRSFSPLRFSPFFFRKSPNFFFPCYSLQCNKFFLFFFLSQGCSTFSLQEFCLPRVTARFLLTFNFLLIICCQTRSKNDSCVTTIGWEIFMFMLWHKRMQALNLKESRRLCSNCIWPQWVMCCMQR